MRTGAPLGSSVAAAIVGEYLGLAFQSLDDAVPHAAIERKRVDQREAWSAGLRRRSMRKREHQSGVVAVEPRRVVVAALHPRVRARDGLDARGPRLAMRFVAC